jgi:hypothetical protein
VVKDPHKMQGKLREDDQAEKIFGTVSRSSRVLISDARALDGWAAARLHMHAEDEFSAGSYGSAKRDAVRILRGTFPTRIVVEGPDETVVNPLITHLDRLITLGALCHLPVGGHKTRGSGWGRWTAGSWRNDDVVKHRSWVPTPEAKHDSDQASLGLAEIKDHPAESVSISVEHGALSAPDLSLADAAAEARSMMRDEAGSLVAWCCEPAIDFSVTSAPEIFGWTWPDKDTLRLDEVAFFFELGCWRVAKTASGFRWVSIREVSAATAGAESVDAFLIPATLPEKERLIVREWRSVVMPVGFTLSRRTA